MPSQPRQATHNESDLANQNVLIDHLVTKKRTVPIPFCVFCAFLRRSIRSPARLPMRRPISLNRYVLRTVRCLYLPEPSRLPTCVATCFCLKPACSARC